MTLDDLVKKCELFPTEVHIIFNDVEDKRLFKAILDNPPNTIYYLVNCNNSQNWKILRLKFFKENINTLRHHFPNIETIPVKVDYENFEDIIHEISIIIGKERYNDPNARIFINVSTGSRITYYASIRAMANWNIDVYTIDENLKYHNINAPASIRPKSKYIDILKIIDRMLFDKYNKYEIRATVEESEQFIKKKDLIDALHEHGYIKLNQKITDHHIRSQYLYTKGKNIFNYLADEIKAITISDDKRNKKIKLTDFGRTILTEFKYLN